MKKKYLSVINIFLCFLLFNIVNANALTLDISTTSINQSNWTFTDGTNSLDPVFSGHHYYEGWNYQNDFVSNDFSGWWQANLEFSVSNLSATGTPYLNLTTFSADDRAALLINDTLIQMVGIFGDNGSGYFNWTKGGALESATFQNNYNDLETAQSFDLSGILQEGNNTLSIIMNDTDSGIYGETWDYAKMTSLWLVGNVEYSEVQNAPVPEPATIILLGTGLLGLAGASRRKFKK